MPTQPSLNALEPLAILRDPASPTLRMRGPLVLETASTLWQELRPVVEAAEPGSRLDFDLTNVRDVDGGAVALLSHLRGELRERGVRSELVGANPQVQTILELHDAGDHDPAAHRRKARGMLDQIGAATLELLRGLQNVLGFVGELALSMRALVRSPNTGNWRAIATLVERSGADAVPIVLLINFLVGLVMAFQASVQLRNFGANVFVADLIGISMTRELGPLMTAIVLTGRSGAAFAAELGTMKVNEEIDALRTMGFGPLRYLVMPRLLALMLVMPILTLLADVVGILGGLVVAVTSLDLTWGIYLSQLRKAVQPWDVHSGLLKSVMFGFAIALIACQRGLATRGGAEGVGRSTTTAVVASLFVLILIDATYTVIFRALEL